MAKLGRNDPCNCGSGNKYKRCCLATEEAAARIERAPAGERTPDVNWAFGPVSNEEHDDLDEVSNRVVDLIQAGRLDEAAQACDELERRYPDCIDWLERRAMLHEKRGELQKAADFARRCLQYTLDWPEGFDEEGRSWMRNRIARLEARQRETTDR